MQQKAFIAQTVSWIGGAVSIFICFALSNGTGFKQGKLSVNATYQGKARYEDSANGVTSIVALSQFCKDSTECNCLEATIYFAWFIVSFAGIGLVISLFRKFLLKSPSKKLNFALFITQLVLAGLAAVFAFMLPTWRINTSDKWDWVFFTVFLEYLSMTFFLVVIAAEIVLNQKKSGGLLD